jgi:hypothetical protein
LDLETVLTRIASHAVQLSGADGERSMNTMRIRRNFNLEAAIKLKRSW